MRFTLLDIAIHKSHHHNKGVWCGNLTSAEILALVENGVIVAEHSEWVVEEAKKSIANGTGRGTWFYFYPHGLKMNVDKKA